MRFGFSDDQRLFQSAVRDLLANECTPAHVREAWSSPDVSVRLRKALGQMGVFGVTIAEAHGGMGLGFRDVVLLAEETGRAAAPVPFIESLVAADVLASAGDTRWLPRIASGDAFVTVALGSFALDADVADLVLVRRDGAVHAVRPTEATFTRHASVDGARRLFSVDWSTAEVLAADVARAETVGALAAAAQLVGLAQHLLAVSVEYAKARHQFGVPIGSFQAVKHHLANVSLAVEFAAPLVYRAAGSLDGGDRAGAVHVAMAKAAASDAAALAARTALQVHGAIGYAFEHDLHLWMKRVWALAAAWGDAGAHRKAVSDQLFG